MRPPKPRLPSNLVELLAKALESFEHSDARFRTLYTIPSQQPQAPPPPPPGYILVLDSSFNPPTLAHQRMVLSALNDPRYKANQSRVLLLLAINNADKAPKPASFAHRLAMMYVFAREIAEEAAVVDIAVTKEPYFHAKALAIASEETYRDGEQIYLTGYDTLIRIFDPKYYPDDSMKKSLDPFFAHARLRVRMRTSDDWGDAVQQMAYLDELRDGRLERIGGRKEWVGRVEMVEGRKVEEAVISSTKVRDAVKRRDWDALGELVSEDVVGWIRENDLYVEGERL
ncbi:Nucleotidylyl transferase [Poronia punctata]|nr:Nucleotidylyl transferase [Poronia punctata]